MNLNKVVSPMRTLAFRTWRSLTVFVPGGRIRAFGGGTGQIAAIMVVNLDDPSKVPMFAEPWFLTFNADVEFRVAMTPEDLARAGLDALGKKWA